MAEGQCRLWHFLEKEAVFEELRSKQSGLSEEEAKRRLQLYGPNALRVRFSASIFRILIRQVHNPLIYVLLLSTGLTAILGKFTDSLVVLSVVILNMVIGFFQEYQADRTIRALTSIVPKKTSVVRNGKSKLVNSSELVPGDVVVLQTGDRIAADLRIFSAKDLECNESTLTGESFPASKKTEKAAIDSPLAERTCMAFNGTYVTCGTGLGVVVATGLSTEFGKIFELVEHTQALETPLELSIKKMAHAMTWGVLIVSLGTFFWGWLRGASLFDASFSAITLAVAAIPEGLPAIITIASSIGVRRMAQKRTIIRQLPAVEALGSTTIICTDKTGTLTYNEMTVQKLWTRSGRTSVSGAGYSLEGRFEPIDAVSNEEIEEILTAAILCSDASLDKNLNGLVPIGDPTEIAILIAGRKKGLLEEDLRKKWHRKDVVPFDPEKRCMATLVQSPGQENKIFVKGAPEEVVAMCEDSIRSKAALQQAEAMAQEGIRVLAIATKAFRGEALELREEDLKEGFILLGFIGMVDPPREGVRQAIKSCYEAGIQVKMITGDHSLTAGAVARDLGILDHGKVITGKELGDFDLERWKQLVIDVQVFARAEPEHKLKLVQVLQSLGHVVAMTGDGVNDAAALKRADIGIAMGIQGTDVAKEASDMILADDNFTSIESAIEEGRRVYDNLLKALAFILPTSLGQALVIFFAMVFLPVREGELVQPILPVQILWVNLIVAVALSLPLAFEAAEPALMKRPPRPKNTPILNGFLLVKTLVVSILMAIGTIGLFFWEYQREVFLGTPNLVARAEAQTMAVTTMVLFQIIYLFSCRFLSNSMTKSRFFSNGAVFIGSGFVLLAQMAFVYLPIMNQFFQSAGIDLESWIVSFLATALMACFLAIEKRGRGNKMSLR